VDQFLVRGCLAAEQRATEDGGDQLAIAPVSPSDPAMKVADEGDTDDKHVQAKRVLKYWLAGREAFENFTTCSMSVDISRVGGRKRMLLAFALPSNVAMWLCPQVQLKPQNGPPHPSHHHPF